MLGHLYHTLGTCIPDNSLAWLGLAWLGSGWLVLAWPGSAQPGLARLGPGRLCFVWQFWEGLDLIFELGFFWPGTTG